MIKKKMCKLFLNLPCIPTDVRFLFIFVLIAQHRRKLVALAYLRKKSHGLAGRDMGGSQGGVLFTFIWRNE